jgi:tetratricopeptide (TPR) repeat protein
MYDLGLPYFEKALDLAKKTPDSGYPIFTYEAQLQALVGMKRYDEAQKLIDTMMKAVNSEHRSAWKAQTLFFAAQIALARGDVREAAGDLQQSIAICKQEGYQQLQATLKPRLQSSIANREIWSGLNSLHFRLQQAAKPAAINGRFPNGFKHWRSCRLLAANMTTRTRPTTKPVPLLIPPWQTHRAF